MKTEEEEGGFMKILHEMGKKKDSLKKFPGKQCMKKKQCMLNSVLLDLRFKVNDKKGMIEM